MTARRTFTLSNGGCRQLKRKMLVRPEGSAIMLVTFGSRNITGNRSLNGRSHQSASPRMMAAEAVDGSGMTFHSTLGKYAILPPVAHSGGSLRGTEPSNRAYATRAPETYSSGRNRYGPEPTTSVIAFIG